MIRFTSGTLVTAALANYALGKARSEAQPAGRPLANLHIDRSPPAREQRIAIMATSCATPVTSPAAALTRIHFGTYVTNSVSHKSVISLINPTFQKQ